MIGLALCAGSAGAVLWLYARRFNSKLPRKPRLNHRRRRLAGAHGAAGWATEREAFGSLLGSGQRPPIPLGAYIENYTGTFHDPARFTDRQILYTGDAHLMTLGGTGEGKDATSFIPSLLRMRGQSIFALDIKHQLFPTTWRWRSKVSRVLVFDPCQQTGFFVCDDPTKAHAPKVARINPLSAFVVHDGNFPPNWVTGIKEIAEGITPHDPKESAHWNDQIRVAVSAFMGYVCTDPEETPTIKRVRELFAQSPDELKFFIDTALRTSPVDLVRNGAANLNDPTTETKNIISGALKYLAFLDDPALSDFLSETTIDLDDLRRECCTLYAVIPPEIIKTYPIFVRLLVATVLNALQRPPLPNQKSTTVLLNEAAKLGNLGVLTEGAGFLRDYGVRLWYCYQDTAQLGDIFGERWKSFVANSGVVQVLGVGDDKTADFISRRIGNHSVPVVNRSFSQSGQLGENKSRRLWRKSKSPAANEGTENEGNSHGVGVSLSESTTVQGVPFLSPQALYGMHPDEGLLLVRKLAFPIRYAKTLYMHREDLKGRFGVDPFHAGKKPPPKPPLSSRHLVTGNGWAGYVLAAVVLLLVLSRLP